MKKMYAGNQVKEQLRNRMPPSFSLTVRPLSKQPVVCFLDNLQTPLARQLCNKLSYAVSALAVMLPALQLLELQQCFRCGATSTCITTVATVVLLGQKPPSQPDADTAGDSATVCKPAFRDDSRHMCYCPQGAWVEAS